MLNMQWVHTTLADEWKVNRSLSFFPIFTEQTTYPLKRKRKPPDKINGRLTHACMTMPSRLSMAENSHNKTQKQMTAPLNWQEP